MSATQVSERKDWPRTLILILGIASLDACSTTSRSLSLPSVDAAAAAAKAIELYDANSDGTLSQDELAKSPPLTAAMGSLDANGDGSLTSDEIETQLKSICGPTSSFTSYSCSVFLDGRPLDGATVKLRPAEFLGDALPPAEGTTDASGTARPSIDRASLPPALANESLVFPGLYQVEITHAQTQLPARYNTATELGCAVNPSSRGDAATARFDLKSQ